MTTRVAIFVDTQNVYYTAREAYGVPQLTAASLINAASEFIPIEGDLLRHHTSSMPSTKKTR